MGLLILFGNQLECLFEGVGAVDTWSAALGPRFYDGLAKFLVHGFILRINLKRNFKARNGILNHEVIGGLHGYQRSWLSWCAF